MKNFDISRRGFVGATAATAALALAGCSSSDDSSSSTGSSSSSSDSTETTTGGELSLYPAIAPATLDPQNDSNSDDQEITYLLGEGLFRFDEDASVVNGVCSSYEVSDDGLTYTFTLGESVWQDGTAVVAGDFVYAFQRIFDPSTASENADTYLSYIEGADSVYAGELDPSELGVSATDDSTLVVTLGSMLAESTVKAFLATPPMYPMNQTAIEAGGDGWSTDPEYHLSNGPYILSEYNADSTVVLEQNSAYVGGAAANASKITYQLYSDSSAADVAMANGEIDYYKYAEDSIISQVGDTAQLVSTELLATAILFFNWNCAPLDDVNVRKAIYLAIDEAYTNSVLESGYATVARGIVGSKFTDPTGGSFRTDDNALIADFSDDQLTEAQQALSDAGYPGGEGFPTLVYLTSDSTKGNARAEFFQALLKDNLGIEVEVGSYDVPTYLSMLTGGGDDWAFTYATTNTSCDNPTEMLSNFVGGTNPYGVAMDEFDELYEQLLVEADSTTQSELMHEAERVALEDYYCCRPVVYGYNNSLYGADCEGIVSEPAGNALHNYLSKTSW